MAATSTDSPKSGDEIEISRFARFMNRLRQVPGVRQERVHRVQSEIAAGTYETEERLDAACATLLADLV